MAFVRTARVPVPSGLDEFAPAPTAPQDTPRVPRSGWAQRTTSQRPEVVRAPYLDMRSTPHVIFVLDEYPAVQYRQHWVRRLNSLPLTCSRTRNEEGYLEGSCPLCSVGHYARDMYMLNVVSVWPSTPGDGGVPPRTEVLTFSFGNQIYDQLRQTTLDVDGNYTKPINDPSRYFFLSRAANVTQIQPVKARDLEEDYQVPPLSSEEIEALSSRLYGENTVWPASPEKLAEIAAQITPEDLVKDTKK